MNGDSEHQESTEERTEQVIRNSQTILSLLNRDGIKVEEISDYHIYPIADNNTPRLSADRFEYTFLMDYSYMVLGMLMRFQNIIMILLF